MRDFRHIRVDVDFERADGHGDIGRGRGSGQGILVRFPGTKSRGLV